jgi:glycine/D-amino acid oxidase-like deaminating enzyme
VKEYSYWLDTIPAPSESRVPNPKSNPKSQIPNPESVDVAIIGAGYTGLSAARRLAAAGASVLVIERETIGWGASSRNGGQVLTGLKLDPQTLVDRWGEARARALFAAADASLSHLESLLAEEAIDCDYERSGHLQAAWKASHFDAFRREQALLARLFGHRVELVPRADQRIEIGSDAYHGLLVDDKSAAINPARYVRGLAAAAERRGARIAAGVGVTSVERRSAGWRVETTAGDVGASDVLIATSGYTGAATPALARRLIPIGSYIVATEPLSAAEAAAVLPRRRVAFDSKHFLYYFRLTRDNRLLFGGRAEFSAPSPASTRRAAAILRRGLARIFPQLADKSIEYAWGGHVAFTRDRLPRAGKLEGAYYAGGYAGHGIAMATYLGDLIARRMAGEPIDHPLMDDRFAPIPLYRGRPWFLPVVGVYYRLLDLAR